MKRIQRLLLAAILLWAGPIPAQVPRVTLESQEGPVALDTLPGQLQILAIGYTRCADVCPTTLAQMKLMLRELGPHAQRVQAVFVSVDYVRDTPAIVGAYTRHFSPQILGLAGDRNQIGRLVDTYPVDMELTGTQGQSGLVVDHSAHFLVMRHGEVVSILPFGLSPEVMAALVVDYLDTIPIGKQ